MQTFSRVYDTYPQAQRVVRDLEAAGVGASDISLVANKTAGQEYEPEGDASSTATGAGVGAALGGGAGLLAGLGMLAIPGIGPVIAAGWLATTAAGAVAGTATGGIIGALIDAGTPESDAHVLSETVRRGGTLVSVRTSHPASAIQDILDRHKPVNSTERRGELEQSGWSGFDPTAPEYRADHAEVERRRRLTE
jgi:hypothetical protein